MQSLLYGRSADRARKTQARLGLALIGFALVYAIIAGRLVIYALASDSHIVRRAVATDAVATARPDILDRNGEVLATDLKTPSLFAEPRRIIDPDEATELLAGVLPDAPETGQKLHPDEQELARTKLELEQLSAACANAAR